MLDKTRNTTTAIKVECRLVDLMKKADDDAWAEAFERCSSQLYDGIMASLRKRGMSPDHAEDILQQTWLTAVENINGFAPEGSHSLYCWLRTVALNHVRNLARKRKSNTTFEDLEEQSEKRGMTLDAYFFEHHIFADSPENVVNINEQIAILSGVLDTLKPRDREIVLRRFLWGQSPKEIATSWGSLKSRSISQLLGRRLKSIRLQFNVKQGIQNRDLQRGK
jgi:RNA polymerase sigma factor (sigma-70 family)